MVTHSPMHLFLLPLVSLPHTGMWHECYHSENPDIELAAPVSEHFVCTCHA